VEDANLSDQINGIHCEKKFNYDQPWNSASSTHACDAMSMKKNGSRLLCISLLQIAAISAWGVDVHANAIDEYNTKPIISGHSVDSRWQERIRDPSDPEIVLGKDWRRSFWAFAPSFVKQIVSQTASRPPQPPHLSVEKLSVGLEGIELRVSWDMEQNLYRCSYHLFISPEVPVSREIDHVEMVSSSPKLPVGIGLKNPPSIQQGMGFLHVVAVFSSEQMLSMTPMLDAYRRNSFGGTIYASFHQGTCAALAHSSAENNLQVGVAIDTTQKYSGVTKKIRDRSYAVFSVPRSLIQVGAPYFRRASKINDCYSRERKPQDAILREPVQFREQRERECKLLRTLPVDSAEKPFDVR
jgi:hypothetical protein